jgi:hypothetical protein
MTPSASRSAIAVPDASPAANSSVTSRTMGIGQSVPSGRRIDEQTDS